jgi:hypothetical protein
MATSNQGNDGLVGVPFKSASCHPGGGRRLVTVPNAVNHGQQDSVIDWLNHVRIA